MPDAIGVRSKLAALILILLSACSSQPSRAASPALPSPAPPPAAGASPTTTPKPYVFVIVMENHTYGQALAGPFTSSLGTLYAVATNYHAVTHPSLPNYLALSSGSTWKITDDDYHVLPPTGIGLQLTEKGIPWRAYMEGMTRGCLDSPYPYAVKHNPFAYYGGACPANVVPLTRFDTDLASGDLPQFVWITPDLCHDTHDCSVAEGDRWLAGIVTKITATSAWQQGGLLLITWDEDDGRDNNRVLTLVVAPRVSRHVLDEPYDHYSLLATVEDRFGLPRLGEAAGARSITL
jgi:acid phosphatase